jgi:two-component system chemotaxis sensor kinase CheA
VAIEIEDDGKGIDPVKMREVAVRKGLMTADEAKSMDDRDAVDIIFLPGFSSAEKITDISGRGVGMDVVRTNTKNLKGTVNVTSEVGKGTKFTLALPLTLAIIDALMVVVAGQTYALPLDSVSETTKIEVRRMTEVNKRKAVTLRGEVLGIVELAEILDLPPTMPTRKSFRSSSSRTTTVGWVSSSTGCSNARKSSSNLLGPISPNSICAASPAPPSWATARWCLSLIPTKSI